MNDEIKAALDVLNAASGADFAPTLNPGTPELKGWHEGSKHYMDPDDLDELSSAAGKLAAWLRERARQHEEGSDV